MPVLSFTLLLTIIPCLLIEVSKATILSLSDKKLSSHVISGGM